MKNRVLHVMQGDKKFNLPLLEFILYDLKLDNHKFLIFDCDRNYKIPRHKNIITLSEPVVNNFFINLFKFYKHIISANVIFAHSAQLSYFFVFFPWKFKYVIWPIWGGNDLPSYDKPLTARAIVKNKIDNFFKRNIRFHASHIEEDSIYANKVLSTKATLIFSPVYLSNVSNRLKRSEDFLYKNGFTQKCVLVGNSTDPSNNHFSAFEKLYLSGLNPLNVISILSYGDFDDYKNNVIKNGIELFGSAFKPITHFMRLNDYLNLLDEVDFAIFNHDRQEGMGVTIQLLSLGKPVFFNPRSPAYCSFVRRGYKVFSIDDLQLFKQILGLDLGVNRDLLKVEYNLDCLKSFYKNI
jgi:dTDP-N-acetylfucosamine:lipid II N-acetylfucosaminyltransferase